MAVVRVPLAGSSGKSVRIERNASIGAQIDTDLRLPDGTVPTLSELAETLAREATDTITEIVADELDTTTTIVPLTIGQVAARACGGM